MTRVVLEARATGGGSPSSTGSEMAMSGSSVVRASGRRRVRKRVDAWRYVFEIWEGWREEVDEAEADGSVAEMGAAQMLFERPRGPPDVVGNGLKPV